MGYGSTWSSQLPGHGPCGPENTPSQPPCCSGPTCPGIRSDRVLAWGKVEQKSERLSYQPKVVIWPAPRANHKHKCDLTGEGPLQRWKTGLQSQIQELNHAFLTGTLFFLHFKSDILNRLIFLNQSLPGRRQKYESPATSAGPPGHQL